MTHSHKPSIDSEMHDLNAEADLLEQKTTIVPGGANGEDTRLQPRSSDPDAQAMVIESLRTQVQDLFSQVSQLNNKLVRSYDRVSDLEDELHVTSSNLRQATIKVSQLELERTQHLSALSTGLLVEKSHVTTELTRLMEKATEEAARRGQAESARAEIEKDLDDLSAGLFDQANRMVAEARIAEARSSRKLEETETALHSAEEVVGALQAQMQALEAEKERTDRRMEEMRIRMGKGKWVDRTPETVSSSRPRLLSSHLPYHEFLLLVSHLRTIRPASAQPPAMSTLLTLPFLARLLAEDSDPTVRLDLAPSLNWLSRRSVLAAIHSGQLTVEPMQFTTLLEELAPPNIPSNSHHTHVVCALCGMSIFSSSESQASTPTTPVPTPRSGAQSASWSTNLFKNVRAGDITLPTFSSHRHSAQFGAPCAEPPSQVYIFRIETPTSTIQVALPLSTQQPGAPARQSIYPLCSTGWCLARLRATCSLWAFVRTSVVEKIWEEPPMVSFTNGVSKPGVNGVDKKLNGVNGDASNDRSPVPMQPPPRRSKIGGFGSLWGSMQRSLSGTREPDTRAATPEPAKPKDDARPKLPPRDPSRKTLPPPPPSHPAAPHAKKESLAAAVHRVPPPFNERAPSPAPTVVPLTSSTPPPLPKRNRERAARSATPETPEPVEHKTDATGATNGVAHSSEPAQPEPQVTEQSEDADVKSSNADARDAQDAPSGPADTVSDAANSEASEAASAEDGPKSDLLITPTMSRATSNDSFSTPTEELSPHLPPIANAAESSATADLAADSPHEEPSPIVQETTPTLEHPVPATLPPAASTVIATPAAAALSKEVEDKPPSRTGSPAPPPLPRRAAARARPSSIPVPPAAEHTSTPTPAADVPAAEQKAEDTSVLSAVAVTPAAHEDAASAAPVAEEHTSAPVTEEPEQIVHEESAVVADQFVAAEKQQSEADAAPVADVVEAPTAAPIAEADEKKVAGEEEAKEAIKEEDGQYVGDTTWEERTYKELIRLREEMFWARVGAVVQ